jgi:hypothetical protein
MGKGSTMDSPSSSEMPEMPEMPPQEEPSLVDRVREWNNWNIADAIDGRIGAVEDALNKEVTVRGIVTGIGHGISRLGHFAMELFDDDEKKDGYLPPDFINEDFPE